jgi:hypothetical protein
MLDDFIATIYKLPFLEDTAGARGKGNPPKPRRPNFGPRTVGVDGVGVGSFPPEAGPGTGDWIRVPPDPAPIRTSTVHRVPPSQQQPRRSNGQAVVRLPPAAVMVPAPLPKPDVDVSEPILVEVGPTIAPAPTAIIGQPGPPVATPFDRGGVQNGAVHAAAAGPAAPASAPGGAPSANPAEPPNAAPHTIPAMAPPVALVGSPMVVGEIADRIPRRYGGRTLLDLMLLMLPIGCLAVAGITFGWVLSWYRDQRRVAARERAEARLRAARRRIAAASTAGPPDLPLRDPGH